MALALGGCASAAGGRLALSAPARQKILERRLGERAKGLPNLLETTPEMVGFALRITAGFRTSQGKAQALARAIVHGPLRVVYDAGVNLTAVEVFESRRANCVSFTNFFVALARSVGLEAYYVDVTERRRYLRRGGVIVHVGHVCAVVREGPDLFFVDFAERTRQQAIARRVMSDLEGLAHFMINEGVDYAALLGMPEHGGKSFVFADQDIERFKLALAIAPTFAKARLNLGTAYLHRGRRLLAEKEFKWAIKDAPRFSPAYIALGNLYFSQKRFDEAIKLFQTALKRQKRNPFLRYKLATSYFTLRRYGKALSAAKTALKIKPDFADAHHLIGIIRMLDSDFERARIRFARALELDPALEDARVRLLYVDSQLFPQGQRNVGSWRHSFRDGSPQRELSVGQSLAESHFEHRWRR